jgi:crotonobetainyl-CoA:carnitine CoA-transferase CaiB-like acyl-CoA transferase
MSAEQPSVEALVERIAKELPNPSWAHAALDSLTAEIERLKGLLYAEQHGKHAEKWNELAAALERAERERDEARVYERQEARNYWIASRNEWKARAQKAEAVVEAARNWVQIAENHTTPFPVPEPERLRAALTAYDEPPTGEGGVT